MNNSVRKYGDLAKEKARLTDLIVFQKAQIKNDLGGIKEELRPVNVAFSFFSKMVTRDRQNPLLNITIKVLSRHILRKIILRRINPIIRKLIIVLFQNYASHALRPRADQLVFRMLSWLRPTKRHQENARVTY